MKQVITFSMLTALECSFVAVKYDLIFAACAA